MFPTPAQYTGRDEINTTIKNTEMSNKHYSNT